MVRDEEIKRGIMTITYRATPSGIYEQIRKEFFVKTPDTTLQNEKKWSYVCTNTEIAPDTIRFTDKELNYLSKIIHNSLFKVHDGLKKLMEYYNQIVGVLTDLNLPLNWITPYGLLIHQRYAEMTNYDVNNYVMSKRQKFGLKKPKEGSIKKSKQIQSFIPKFSALYGYIKYCYIGRWS